MSFLGYFLASFLVMLAVALPAAFVAVFVRKNNPNKQNGGALSPKFARRKKFITHGQNDFSNEN